MNDLTIRLEASKKAVIAEQNKAAVALAEQVRLKNELANNLAVLKDTFGCSSLTEAKELLASLEVEVETKLAEVEEQLNALRS